MLSENFWAERGMKQGSVLSPALFLSVMDPLLRQLQASGVGFTVNKFYAGGFLHADDVRTCKMSDATSEEYLQCQVALVKAFAKKNLLKLNVSICKIVLFSSQKGIAFPVCEVEGLLCQLGMQENVWVTGGGETYLHLHLLMRTSGKLVVLFPFW